MTFQEKVLEAVRQHRHQKCNSWQIRFAIDGTLYCPITLAARHYFRTGYAIQGWENAAWELGALNHEEATIIVNAADSGEGTVATKRMRKILLDAIATPYLLPVCV